MDFNDSPEEAAFRAEARSWLAENAIPPSELSAGNILESQKPWVKRLYEGGWSCINWPEEYGGRGASAMEKVIWEQEEARYPHLRRDRFTVGHALVGPTLMKWYKDRPETLERLLPPIASGEESWVQLFSEPAGGSDLAALRTKAEPRGDEWLINGQKIWSSNAVESKWGFLVTRTDPSVAKHLGLTVFYVDMESAGVEIRPIQQINGEAEFNEVFFTDVLIPDSQRIGEVGQGWEVALSMLSHERLFMGTDNFDVSYERLCELFKMIPIDGKPAIENVQVRAKLADFYCVEAGLNATMMRAISAVSQGKDLGPEISVGSMILGARTQEMLGFALDVMDQAGVIWDESSPQGGFFQSIFMTVPTLRIAGGTDEIQANVIAENVLGLPREARADKGVPFNEIPAGK